MFRCFLVPVQFLYRVKFRFFEISISIYLYIYIFDRFRTIVFFTRDNNSYDLFTSNSFFFFFLFVSVALFLPRENCATSTLKNNYPDEQGNFS